MNWIIKNKTYNNNNFFLKLNYDYDFLKKLKLQTNMRFRNIFEFLNKFDFNSLNLNKKLLNIKYFDLKKTTIAHNFSYKFKNNNLSALNYLKNFEIDVLEENIDP